MLKYKQVTYNQTHIAYISRLPLERKDYEYSNSNNNSISIHSSNDKDRRLYYSFFICLGRYNKYSLYYLLFTNN